MEQEIVEEKPDIERIELIKIESCLANDDPENIFCPQIELKEIHQESSINNSVAENNTEKIKKEITEPVQEVNSIVVTEDNSKKTDVTGKVYENGKINRIECPQCKNSFKNRANLKRHITNVHAPDCSQECSVCYRAFKSKAHLRCHIQSVHSKEKEITCDTCKKTFLSKKKLHNHIFYAHPDPEESVKCDVCNKSFKKLYIMKVHKRQVHSNCSIKCLQCGREFKNEMLLQRHIKWSHPIDGMMYKCQECGRILPSIACYRQHMENVHAERNIECDICFKTLKNDKSLRRHKTMHTGEPVTRKEYKPGEIQCTECDKKFAKITNLTWHFEQCHSENKRSNTCSVCDKEFSDNACLKRHILSNHSSLPANCSICEKSFKSDYNLQRHIRITHAPPEAAETCSICKKTFKCVMHLRTHMNAVHPKTGSFTCDICSKEFSSKKYMVKHRKIHVQTKDFPCELCDKFFKSVHDVTKHVRRVHNKKNLST